LLEALITATLNNELDVTMEAASAKLCDGFKK
jgi:hypothetical protein